MSHALSVPVKESNQELRSLLKSSIPFFQHRIKFLLVLKKYGDNPVSKRVLMEESGYCSDSVQKWRSIYASQGIKGLLTHNKVGFKQSIISKQTHAQLEAKLKDPENGIQGYKELNEWILKECNTEISGSTIFSGD
jgi:hypothetical protein